VRRKQGFTLVEVMVSIGVMTIGAMAVMAMQQQLTRANRHAREISTASQIAQNWIERFKLDALRWNVVGGQGATTYLGAVPAPGTQGAFTTIPAQTATLSGVNRLLSPGFDYYGQDVDVSAGNATNLYYCASHRLNWVYNNQRAMRVDVRVWWGRDGMGNIQTAHPRCIDDNTALNPGGASYDNFHIVYLSTVIKVTPI
jgi:prepilin-type N-terminal cleavage/methylation domain-containing protein